MVLGGLWRWFFAFFFSTPGVVVLAALDSSIVFTLPFAIDAAVVILAAQHRDLFWLYPIIVIPSSLAGAASTYWLGMKLGEEGLQRLASKERVERLHERVRRSGAFALAALDLVPPPFPFTPIILAAGALDVAPRKFFVTLAGARVIRFGGEAVLALVYGDVIVSWLESETVRTVAGVLLGLFIVGAVYSSYRLVRSTAGSRRPRSLRA